MRFPAAVAAALVLAALPAPAQAAGCAWTTSELPTHPNVEHERVTGMSPDGSISVGDAINTTFGTLNGILWSGTTAVGMADPNRGPDVDNAPAGVNNAGVVGGYIYDRNTDFAVSYRYNTHDGTYEWLHAPDGAVAYYINERGDVAGWVRTSTGTEAVIWRAGSVEPLVIGHGQPVGLDDDGRVVTTDGEIWSPDAKTVRIRDLRGARPTQYAYGRAVGVNRSGEIIEWGLHGTVTRVIPGAWSVSAVNSGGMIGGMRADGVHARPAIWTGGVSQDVDGGVNGITDAGVAYGQRDWQPVVHRCI